MDKRYVKICYGTLYCGTDGEEYLYTDMTDEELESYCNTAALDNAEQYDYMVFGWDQTAESYAEENGISLEEAEQELEDYYAEAWGDWQIITKEEYYENI